MSAAMDFLVYSRAIPESDQAEHTADEEPLNERHWAYMDGFARGMTARGPTLGPDRDSWTGSLHIVDLPDARAVRAFVDDEPYQRAGLFADHVVLRFNNLLGRTMWEFPDSTQDPKFLIIAQVPTSGREAAPLDDVRERLRDLLVVYGALGTLDDRPAGVALAVQVASRGALEALLADPSLGLSGFGTVEVHDWEFGGRR